MICQIIKVFIEIFDSSFLIINYLDLCLLAARDARRQTYYRFWQMEVISLPGLVIYKGDAVLFWAID